MIIKDTNLKENKIFDFTKENELSLPNIINLDKLNQKPEKIKKLTSKTIEVPSISDEITKEQIMPNNPIRKDILKPYILKEEDIEDINEKLKEPIYKINIVDNLYESSNLDLNNPDYLNNQKEEDKSNLIPKFILKSPEINLIESSKELDKELNKYDITEKPKEIKDIKMGKDYSDKKLVHKIPQTEKLPLLYNYYQLPEIKEIEIDESKESEDEKKKVLRGRKDDKKTKEEVKEDKENEKQEKESEKEEEEKEKESEKVKEEKESEKEEELKEELINKNIIENEKLVNNKSVFEENEIIKSNIINNLESPKQLKIFELNQIPEIIKGEKEEKVETKDKEQKEEI